MVKSTNPSSRDTPPHHFTASNSATDISMYRRLCESQHAAAGNQSIYDVLTEALDISQQVEQCIREAEQRRAQQQQNQGRLASRTEQQQQQGRDTNRREEGSDSSNKRSS